MEKAKLDLLRLIPAAQALDEHHRTIPHAQRHAVVSHERTSQSIQGFGLNLWMKVGTDVETFNRNGPRSKLSRG